ncbi:hypothetical protein RYX36_002476, partial [Vicia faba]
ILPMLKVACLPSHPLDKLVARKKRRGREASLPPVVEVLGATLIQKQMYKVDRCLADPLLPIRVGLTQKSKKNGALLIQFREDERQRKGSGGFLIGEREGTFWT